MNAPPEPTDLGAVLALLREHAVGLTTAVVRPPARVRVEATGAAVELGWSLGPSPIPAEPVEPAAPPRTATPTPADPGPPVGNGSGPSPVDTAHRITAPTVGTFYRAPDPGARPFVAEGDVVTPGQQVAIIEAMKLMIPVEADRGGRVVEVLCGDGDAVEYGQALVALDAS